jgi:hypothetical protein
MMLGIVLRDEALMIGRGHRGIENPAFCGVPGGSNPAD